MNRFICFITLFIIFLFPFLSNAQNFWQHTSGPDGGDIICLALNSNGHIFAGSRTNGVYLSTDNGNNWSQKNTLLTSPYIRSLAINSNGHIFVGTNPVYGTSGGGIYRSTDNGNTWAQINIGLTGTDIWGIFSLVVSSSGFIFAGTEDYKVFLSTNNGNNWIQVGTLNGSVLSFAITSNGHIFAGTKGGGVYRSTDNGNNWTQINTGLTNKYVQSLAINSIGQIFAGTNVVYRSTDNGNIWTQVSLEPTYITSFAINSSGHIFYGANAAGVYRSTDNGNNWTQLNKGLTNTAVLSLVISPNGYIFAGVDGKVFRSIQSTTSIDETDMGIPPSFVLLQNYPNPFNPITTIKFALPVRAKVNLSIYNLLGEKVAELVNEQLGISNHEIEWNASNYSSGIYFYSINTVPSTSSGQAFREIKKMILVK